MKAISILVIFLFIHSYSIGQQKHLSATNFENEPQILKQYFEKLFPLLYQGFLLTPYARFTCIPSFQKEYAFSLEKISSKYYIYSNTFNKSLWYSSLENHFNKVNVKLKSEHYQIDESLYQKVGILFKLLVDQMAQTDSSRGLDGESYYFSSTNSKGKILTGETWSPEDSTLLNRVILICNNLYNYGNLKPRLKINLSSSIDSLIYRIER